MMSDSTDSEVQFNMNANRPIEPVNDDAQPQMLPDPQIDNDAMVTEDPEEDYDVDDLPDAQDDPVADNTLEDEREVDQSTGITHRSAGSRTRRRNHIDGDQELRAGTDSPVRFNLRGRPRHRIVSRQLPRRYDDSDDSGNEDQMMSRNRQGMIRHLPRHNQGDFRDQEYATTSRRGRGSLPAIKPETYDGTSDWESYFSHFTNCADLGRWTDGEKALALASCLSGPARIFYLGLRDEERKIYRVLVRKLNERFGSKKQQTRYITKFESRRRGAGETVASFGDDLRLTAQRAYPDLDANAQESLALHQFYKTLSPEMKCRCIDRDCKTVEQAIEVVERYEAILGSDEKKRTVIRTISGASNPKNYSLRDDTDGNHDQGLLKQIQQILTRLEKMESKMDGEKTGSAEEATRKEVRGRSYSGCYICKSTDHYARDCPSRPIRPKYNHQKSGNSRPLV